VLADEYGREGVLTPGGVNLQQFAPAKERESRPTILFSGAISERRKGIPVLLEALAILLKTEPSLRLWLSGPGDPTPYFEGVPTQVVDAVEVLPIGAASGQADRYGRAWATALPSVSDSFGMALLESLACGTPIVASSDAALPELVDPGKTGTLCDPKSAASVAEALAQAMELAGLAGTAESCRASAKKYDWKTSLAPSFANLYESA
jgi:phosphatidylinositol alpha-mannosyltransferase